MSEDTPNWGKMVENVRQDLREESVREMLEAHKRQIPMLAEMAEAAAKIKRVNFEALVKAGFSPQEAILLIK